MDIRATSVCDLMVWHARFVCIIRNNNDVISRYTTVIIENTKQLHVSAASHILYVRARTRPYIVQSDQKVSVHLAITVHTIDDFKMAITEFIRNVDSVILNAVFENTVRRVNKCLETGGGHSEQYL